MCSERIFRVTVPGYVPMFRLAFTQTDTGRGISLAKRSALKCQENGNKWLVYCISKCWQNMMISTNIQTWVVSVNLLLDRFT